MRIRIAMAMVILVSLANASRAATLDDILARNLAAHGGARLREIKTLRMTGHVVFGGRGRSIETPWAMVQKRRDDAHRDHAAGPDPDRRVRWREAGRSRRSRALDAEKRPPTMNGAGSRRPPRSTVR